MRGTDGNVAFGEDDIDTAAHQRPGQLGESVRISIAPSRDQDQIASLHITVAGQRALERVEFPGRGRRSAQKADAPYPIGLLRVCDERRRDGRHCHGRNEVPPSHVPFCPQTPHQWRHL